MWGGGLLDVAELNGIDDFFPGEDIGDDDQPGAGAAPVAALEVGDGVLDGFLGVFLIEGHEERLDAPWEHQLAEDSLVISEGVDGDTLWPEAAEGVTEEAAAGEDHDAGVIELLGEDGGAAEHLGLGLIELDALIEDALVVGLGEIDDFLHHPDALEGVEAGGGLTGKHHGIRALADGVCDIGNLGAGGHGG